MGMVDKKSIRWLNNARKTEDTLLKYNGFVEKWKFIDSFERKDENVEGVQAIIIYRKQVD